VNLDPSMRVGPFAVDPWVRFAKRVLLPALSGGIPKVLTELERCPLESPELLAASGQLPILLGAPLGRAFQAAVETRDAAGLTRLVPLIRRAASRRSWLSGPASATARAGKALWRRIRQPFSPSGPIVCIVGPPDAGRTSLVDSICGGDRLVFTACIRARASVERPAPATALHRLGRVAAHITRWAGRSLVTDRLHSSRQRLVVYDGCALDPVVNPGQFGPRSSLAVRACCRLLPQPDLVVLLVRPEIVLDDRESEPSAPQATPESSAWQELLASSGRAVVVRADTSPEELHRKTMKLIVAAFINKNRQHRRGGP
jgi:hypothetical protein